MNKRDAKALADEQIITADHLRQLVAASSRDGMSKVNPTLSKEMALKIFEGALSDYSGKEVIRTIGYLPSKGRDGRKSCHLMVTNVLRECAPAGWRPSPIERENENGID